MKGQTSMMAIVIIIILMVFLMIFLATSTTDEGNMQVMEEYRNLFASNMLLSILNTDTSCGTFSDMLKAEYFGSGKCGDTAFTDHIDEYVDHILLTTGHTDYDWMIEAEPKDFNGITREWGHGGEDGVKSHIDRRNSLTILTWGGRMLEVRLYLRTK